MEFLKKSVLVALLMLVGVASAAKAETYWNKAKNTLNYVYGVGKYMPGAAGIVLHCLAENPTTPNVKNGNKAWKNKNLANELLLISAAAKIGEQNPVLGTLGGLAMIGKLGYDYRNDIGKYTQDIRGRAAEKYQEYKNNADTFVNDIKGGLLGIGCSCLESLWNNKLATTLVGFSAYTLYQNRQLRNQIQKLSAGK